jgi:hypothetical protein
VVAVAAAVAGLIEYVYLWCVGAGVSAWRVEMRDLGAGYGMVSWGRNWSVSVCCKAALRCCGVVLWAGLISGCVW